MSLTKKQEKYVAYMLALPVEERARAKTAAALAADYSAATARVQGARLWNNRNVIEALGRLVTRLAGPVTDPLTPEAEPLNDRQAKFCLEYLIDGNATRSYMRAYPRSSYEAARRSAHEFMTNPDILARINELKEERNRKLGISAEKVLSVLARQAFYDPRDLFDADWRLKPFDELPPDAAFIVTGFTTKATTAGEDDDGICVLTNVKLSDKARAAELLGRHLKLFTDKIEVAEDNDFTRRLDEAVRAAKEARRGGKK